MKALLNWVSVLMLTSALLTACSDDEDTTAAATSAADATDGMDGTDGTDGMDGTDGTDGTTTGNIAEVATANGNFTTLVALLDKAGLVETIATTDGLTVFAPTDAAFADASISADDFNTEEEIAALRNVLLYHVVQGRIESSTLTDGAKALTLLGGAQITVGVGDAVTIDGVRVGTPDVMASNGIIHVMDGVLSPPGNLVEVATAAGSFNTLLALVTKAGLAETVASAEALTIFAPTDEAFASAGISADDFNTEEEITALTGILLYHVVSGINLSTGLNNGEVPTLATDQSVTVNIDNGVTIDGIPVATADVGASNGVIHVISGVLMPGGEEMPGNIAEVATANGNFNTLLALLTKAGLADTIATGGPFTVFAPTDDVFAEAGISADNFNSEAEIAALTNILLYHVVSGKVMSGDLQDDTKALTLAGGAQVSIDLSNGVMIDDTSVVTPDVAASNGVIHVIDGVLTPPGNLAEVATDAGAFNTLLALLTKAGLAETVATGGPFTVFAPSDQAFAEAGISADDFNTEEEIAALTSILLYHVVEGVNLSTGLSNGQVPTLATDESVEINIDNGVTVDGIEVVTADVGAINGVIHVIDGVLLPSSMQPGNIAEVATEAGSFNTLLALLTKAGLADTIANGGPFTVFAPTDQAFASAGISADDFNTEAEIAALTNVLLYHVVSGKVMSGDLVDGTKALTLLGGAQVSIDLSNGVMIDGATVDSPDIAASNGVIHVINDVLTPPGNLVEVAAAAGSFGTLLALATKAGLAETLSTGGPFTVFAPTDQAFASAGIAPENFNTPEEIATLTDVLLYHVADGIALSSDLSDGMSIDTLLTGQSLDVDLSNGVMIGTASVATPDVGASNAVIHVISTVLLPPAN